jgi:hypothetical protein
MFSHLHEEQGHYNVASWCFSHVLACAAWMESCPLFASRIAVMSLSWSNIKVHHAIQCLFVLHISLANNHILLNHMAALACMRQYMLRFGQNWPWIAIPMV